MFSYFLLYTQTDQFVARDLQGVLVTDSLASSRPISIPVSTPEEINQQFDSISYNKVNPFILFSISQFSSTFFVIIFTIIERPTSFNCSRRPCHRFVCEFAPDFFARLDPARNRSTIRQDLVQ